LSQAFVVIGVVLGLRGRRHTLPQASESADKEEILERLAKHVAARNAFFFGNLVQLAPDGLRKTDRHRFPHDVLDLIRVWQAFNRRSS